MNKLPEKIKQIRKTILEVSYLRHLGHIGSALSVANVIAILYEEILNISLKTLKNPKRDRFILSKGHASVALYSTLYHKGFIDKETLFNINADGAILGEHNDYNPSLGIEYSGGSLGHGLSVASGMALGLLLKYKNHKNLPRVYTLISDAELNEGSIWEAIMYIPQKKIKNLCLIIDDNNSQCMGKANEIINLHPLGEKIASFGWHVDEVKSKDYLNLSNKLKQVGKLNNPLALIVKSHIGEGISFMENDFKWHYFNLDEDKYLTALNDNEKYL